MSSVDGGYLTKDLALAVHGDEVTEDKYVTTQEFIEAVKDHLDMAMEKDKGWRIRRTN